MKSLAFTCCCIFLTLALALQAGAQEDKAKALEAAAVAYTKAGLNGDIATALRLLPKAQVPKFEHEFQEEAKTAKKVGLENLKVVSVDVEKNQVTLQISDEAKVTWQLVQEDGTWKVDLARMRGDPKVALVAGQVRPDLVNLQNQLEIYKLLAGTLPSTPQGLATLVAEPAGDPQPRRWQQLMDKVPRDPWGNLYHYTLAGKRSKDPYEVFSAGPDGKPNTKDDIGNW